MPARRRAPYVAVSLRLALLLTAFAAAGCSAPRAPAPPAARYVIGARGSRVELHAHDVAGNPLTARFGRLEGWVDAERGMGLSLRLDATSLAMSPLVLTPYVRDAVLDADRFPVAIVEGSIRETDAAKRLAVADCSIELHGVRRPLRLEGRLDREGEAVRFFAIGYVRRSDFGVRTAAETEPLLRDELRVMVNVLAKPAS